MTHTSQTQKPTKNRTSERGSALVYILIAIALLAALTVSFMEPSSQQTSSQGSFRTVTGLKTQIDSIRASIQECILRYPNGDTSIDVSSSGDNEGAAIQYPIYPNSTELPVASRSGDRLVRNIRCPGNNGGTPGDHQLIFSGSSGKFLPPAPDLFEDWEYSNGTDGVFFFTRTDNSDAFLQTALQKLDANFGTCEADIVVAAGSAEDMDTITTTPEITCPANNTCFRVWMTVNSGASATHQDAGCGT